jgi:hypothetical protein
MIHQVAFLYVFQVCARGVVCQGFEPSLFCANQVISPALVYELIQSLVEAMSEFNVELLLKLLKSTLASPPKDRHFPVG